jgi:hypothetical protein
LNGRNGVKSTLDAGGREGKVFKGALGNGRGKSFFRLDPEADGMKTI